MMSRGNEEDMLDCAVLSCTVLYLYLPWARSSEPARAPGFFGHVHPACEQAQHGLRQVRRPSRRQPAVPANLSPPTLSQSASPPSTVCGPTHTPTRPHSHTHTLTHSLTLAPSLSPHPRQDRRRPSVAYTAPHRMHCKCAHTHTYTHTRYPTRTTQPGAKPEPTNARLASSGYPPTQQLT